MEIVSRRAIKSFSVHPVPLSDETILLKGVFIILLNAESIPPHLLAAVNGTLFSISVAGQHAGSPLQPFLQLVRRKKAPVLLVEWKLPSEWNAERIENEFRKNILRYEKVEAGKISCLHPIRDTVSAVYGEEMNKARFIFELFPLMRNQNAIGTVYGMHLENSLGKDGEFTLVQYSPAELEEAILKAGRKLR